MNTKRHSSPREDEKGRQLRDRPARTRPRRRQPGNAHRPIPPAGHARLQGCPHLSLRTEPREGKEARRAGTANRRPLRHADPSDRQHAEIVKANLRAIGIDVQVKILPDAVFFRRLGGPRGPYDLALTRWYGLPDPVTFLGFFDPRTSPGNPNQSINNSYYNDPAYTRRLAAAERTHAIPRIQSPGVGPRTPRRPLGGLRKPSRPRFLLRPHRLPDLSPDLQHRSGSALSPQVATAGGVHRGTADALLLCARKASISLLPTRHVVIGSSAARPNPSVAPPASGRRGSRAARGCRRFDDPARDQAGSR